MKNRRFSAEKVSIRVPAYAAHAAHRYFSQPVIMNTPIRSDEARPIIDQLTAMLSMLEHEERDFTDDERAEYDSLMARLQGKGEDRPRIMPRVSESPEPGAPPLDDRPMIQRVEAGYSGGKLKAFANSRQGEADAYRSGMWIHAQLFGHAGAMERCRAMGMPLDIRAAHSESENAKGGALVPEELSRTIIRLVELYGIFRANTRVMPMSSDTLSIPRRTGGLTAYYVGENQAGTESDTSWDNVNLTAKKLMILTRMSSELSEDSIIAMADLLATEASLAFAMQEDMDGFLGDGTSAYGGITGVFTKAIDGNHALAKIEAASGHDTLLEIDADDLLKLMAAVPKFAKMGGAKWYCSPEAEEIVFNAIKASGGGNTESQLAARQAPGFLGYPIETSEVLPGDLSATYNGTPVIGFGNLAMASTLGSRRDIRFRVSDTVHWEEDQIAIKATMRHDINVHDLGSGTVKSPFAVLVGKS